MKSGEAKEIVQLYFQRLLNERDPAVCEEMLASDYIDHDAPAGTPPGPESIRAFVAKFLDDYPDLRVVVEDILAEGTKVAARLHWHGMHRISGKTYDVSGIVLIHLNARGQFKERWSAYFRE